MNRRPLCAALGAVLAAATLSACSVTIDADLAGARDPGPRATETREVSDVTAVELETIGTLNLSVGAPALTVTAGENVLERLITEVRGDTLEIDLRGSWRSTDIQYDLTLPSLEEITIAGSGEARGQAGSEERLVVVISGSGDVRLDDVAAGRVETTIAGSGAVRLSDVDAASVDVTVTGSGAVTLEGTGERLSVLIPGSGELRARDLRSTEAVVSITGSGDAHVHTTGSLDASIAGSGRITYLGNPDVTRRIAGSGDIEPAD